jgi:hypothetical protein
MSTANNNEVTSLLSLAGTVGSAQTSTLQANPYGRGVKVFVNVTTNTSGTFTVTIQGLLNGQAVTLLTSAALNASGVLTVYPGLTASANVIANDILPKQWQVVFTPSAWTGVANIGACVVV